MTATIYAYPAVIASSFILARDVITILKTKCRMDMDVYVNASRNRAIHLLETDGLIEVLSASAANLPKALNVRDLISYLLTMPADSPVMFKPSYSGTSGIMVDGKAVTLLSYGSFPQNAVIRQFDGNGVAAAGELRSPKTASMNWNQWI